MSSHQIPPIQSSASNKQAEDRKKKRDPILNLDKYIDKRIFVKFMGGREMEGVLMGHDKLLNLVLDDAVERIRDSENPSQMTEQTRRIGMTVCRGPSIILISPLDGKQEIENPFVQ
ncbi:Sm-like protein lsm7 [Spiromyces aspiralis]|uniref:Sm-like protein lsm7 n=1 Tax=Spiromyces aspiralis TaxID=68401 RepID=A0ACC1HP67_9FUNG|nr:Sm-like protein lsm7 [Spiromyces aspiralis]